MITKFILEVDNEFSYSLIAPNTNLESLSALELAVIETYLRYAYKTVRETRDRKEGTNMPFPIGVKMDEDQYT